MPPMRLVQKLAIFLSAIACFAGRAGAAEPAYDLMIAGAVIVDGTGGEPFKGDVLVRGDQIALVGQAPAGSSATRVIILKKSMIADGGDDA